MITYRTPKSQGRRTQILALIATCALSTEAICEAIGLHRAGIGVYLRGLRDDGLVRIHRKQAIRNGVGQRFYWIAASAPLDAPWLEYLPPEEDIEAAMRAEAQTKLAQIKPFRDWTAAWIPNRAANSEREAA